MLDPNTRLSTLWAKYLLDVYVSFMFRPDYGSMSDITALRESGLIQKIRSENLNERLLADKDN